MSFSIFNKLFILLLVLSFSIFLLYRHREFLFINKILDILFSSFVTNINSGPDWIFILIISLKDSMFKYVSLLPIDALYSGIYLYIIKKSAAIRIIKMI